MEVKGKIKVIGETQTFDSGFQKRQFVITTDETYPQDIAIDMIKDKCSLLDGFKIDDKVVASINIRGNEYNGKYYVNIQAWKLFKDNECDTAQAESIGEEDKLPF